jgi:hypothetical protein
MTKMDMIWIAVATMIHPDTSSSRTVTLGQIEAQVFALWRKRHSNHGPKTLGEF